MTQSRHVDQVEEYLGELRAALRQASAGARAEYISDISAHIDEAREALDPNDEHALHDLLNRIGSPLVLAEEFFDNQREHRAEVRANTTVRDRVKRYSPYVSLALVLILVFVGSMWIRYYQPVGSGDGAVGEVLTAKGTPAASSMGIGFEPITWTEPTGRFSLNLVVSLANEGWLPITVDRVESPFTGLPYGRRPYIQFTSVEYKTLGAKFHAFTLGAHQTTYISIHQSESCRRGYGSGTGWQDMEIQTSFYGYHRWVEIPMVPFALLLGKNCR